MPDLLQSRFISDIQWEFLEQLQELFEPFGIYLDTECGMMASTREQTIADFRRLIIAVNATDIESLTNKNNIKTNYLALHCKAIKHSSDSIKKYLTSFSHFCSFLIADEWQIGLGGFSYDGLFQMKIHIENWKPSYNTAGRNQFWERHHEEFEMLVKHVVV